MHGKMAGEREKYIHCIDEDMDDLKKQLEKIIGNEHTRKILRFPGGDYWIADILLPRIEKLCIYDRCTFVEVFGGSGFISQNVNRNVFTNIIYNDINDKLTALYKTIKENPEKLALILTLLPHSRSIYEIMVELLETSKELASLVTAVLYFYSVNTSIYGKIGKSNFGYSIKPEKNEARAFKTKVWSILKYADAWKDITIENLDFRKAIKTYDRPKTVFYFDPPYPDRATDYYGYPFTVNDLKELAEMLTSIQGKFLLKLDADTYSMIEDILPKDMYNVEFIEKMLSFNKVRDKKRKKWILVLVSNHKKINMD